MRVDTTAEDSHDETDPRDSALVLQWVSPEVSVEILRVGQGPWRLGREANSDILVNDAEASRQHAVLFLNGPLVVVKDLGSRNGTFVNGARIEQCPLKHGSVVRIGNWVGLLRVGERLEELQAGFSEPLPGYYLGPASRRAIEPALRAARGALPVLIEGATGTGKERVAEHIHIASGRSGPFHAVNCAAIPGDTAESQLFGHRKGAFTGAHDAYVGHFRAANSGTLFLDELAELAPTVQAKLLRVLQEKKVTPLGDTKAIPVDVRVLASCQEPLTGFVSSGAFRADLLARVSGLVVKLPGLAERVEEVPYLLQRLLARHASGSAPSVDGKLVESLCLYSWPGNIRELELLVQQMLLLHGNEHTLKRSHLPSTFGEGAVVSSTKSSERQRCQLAHLVEALHATGGNLSQATVALGISRAKAYRLMAGDRVDQLLARYPLTSANTQPDENGARSK
jgi:transcriptional regulator of acetoin/glycerol metabolism